METIKATEAASVLREMLRNGRTEFVFVKKDFTERHAVGTTNLDLVPQDLWPKDMSGDGTEVKNESLVNFFDLEKGAWRSCNVNSIINIDGKEVVE